MKRKRLLTIGIVLIGALVLSQVVSASSLTHLTLIIFDVFFFALAFVTLGKRRPAPTIGREVIRLGISVVLLLIAATFGFVTEFLANAASASPRAYVLWILISRSFPAYGYSWMLLILIRLGGDEWNHRRRRVVAGVSIAFFLILIQGPVTLMSIAAIFLVLAVAPFGWLLELKGRQRWLGLLLLLIAVPAALILMSISTESFTGRDEMQFGLYGAGGPQNSVLGMAGFTLSLYFFFLPIRIVVAGLQGAFGIRIPIWLKLAFTYIFSTIIPGFLLVTLLTLSAYLGIGTLRARMVRNLVHDDLNMMEKSLRQEDFGSFNSEDSIAVGIYERESAMIGMEPDQAAIPQFRPGIMDPAMEAPLSIDPSIGGYPGENISGLGVPPSAISEFRDIHWIRVESVNAPWPLPDTLMPFAGYTTRTRSIHGIQTFENNSALTVVVPERFGSNRIYVAMRPLNESLLNRYKDLIGVDISILPSTETMMGDEDDEESQTTIQVEDRQLHIGNFSDMLNVGTEWDSLYTDLWHFPIYQGVSELMSWQEEGEDSELLGFIIVRTSLAELAQSLFNMQGLNIIVVGILIFLGILLLLAVLFSSILGLGITTTITSAVAELREGTENLRKGNLKTRIKVTNRDELGDLAISFNRMITDLQRMVGAIAEKERLERDIQIARIIQVRLLPSQLPISDVAEIAGTSEPAQEVGGDYYDAFELDNGEIMIAVGDVSGKGVPAAILMSNLQANLHVLARQHLPLETIVQQINEEIYRNSTLEMFITFFVGILNPDDCTLRYVNAGHDAPYLLRKNKVINLTEGGMILGIMPDLEYKPASVELEDGDLIGLYSDGITEIMDAADVEFGRERLISVTRSLIHAPARNIIDGVINMVHQYAGNDSKPQDDITLMVLKIH